LGADGAELLRGVDAEKDQSYFLFPVRRDALAHTLFPVGALRKEAVRQEAARRGLPVANKPDSQEICFVPDGAYATFVERRVPAEDRVRGTIVDAAGSVVGTHEGVHRFTIGQRRGLGVPGGGPPRYVTEIDAAAGVVRIGSHDEVASDGLRASQANWLGSVPQPGTRVTVKIRSRFAPQAAVVVESDETGFAVRSEGGLRAVTPGQAAVLYDGDRVLGGGWIDAAVKAADLECRAAGSEAGGA
jgi:tRNA-specific 2-thiouridylase